MADIPSTNDAFNQALPAGEGLNQAFDSATTPMASPTPPDSTQPAVSANPASSGPVNVLNPQGKLVSIPGDQLQDALASGYKQADDSHVAAYLKNEKYGTGEQMLKTGLEGAASAATFGLSTAAEEASGLATAEDIQGRRETNPGVHMLGQAAGLAGSAFIPGVGAANILKDVGEGAAALTGLAEGGTILSKIGSGVVSSAVENALFQSGDEVSKMISKDPTQTAQTAMTDIGLAGLIGGGIGGTLATANPLWEATVGPKVSGFLKAFTDKMGGIDGAGPGPLDEAIGKAGIEVPPEVRAGMSDDPKLRRMASTLNQSDTTSSGVNYQAAATKVRQDASDSVMNALGKTKEQIQNYSEAEQGRQGMETFKKEYKNVADPITKEYGAVTDKFKDMSLTDAAYGNEPGSQYVSRTNPTDTIAAKISAMADEAGIATGDSPQTKFVNNVLTKLNKVDTIQDLSKLNTMIRETTTGDPTMYHVAGQLKKIILDSQQELIGNAAERESPQLFERYSAVRKQYANLARVSDEMGSNLSIGKFHGPGDFLNTLETKRTPEEFLKKLSPKGNAEIIPFLKANFPETLGKVQENELYQLAKPAVKAAAGDQAINVKTLVGGLQKAAPELRGFVVSDEAAEKIAANHQILEALNDPSHNFSNTARTADKLLGDIPGAAVSAVSLLASHNPASALLLGGLTKVLSKDAPDAARLAILKFMGSNQPIDAAGFKAAVDYIHHTIRGEKLVGSTIKNIFQTGKTVLPEGLLPTQKDRENLDKKLQNLKTNPEKLLDVGGKTSSYMPDHGQALAQTSTNAANYLNSMRPNTQPSSPLDSKITVSAPEKAAYNRALTIAQQPLVVLDSIKKGSITPQDVQHLSMMYPALYSKLKTQVTAQMTNSINKGTVIPYSVRIGLGTFLGQPLDSTMTAQGIATAQVMSSPQSPQQPGGQEQHPKHSMTALNKLPGAYQTPEQARAAARAKDQS